MSRYLTPNEHKRQQRNRFLADIGFYLALVGTVLYVAFLAVAAQHAAG